MLFKFNVRSAGDPLPFSGRYLTRLLLLSAFCVVAMVAIGIPAMRSHPAIDGQKQLRGGELAGGGRRDIEASIAPSPYSDLGMGVIVADDRPRTNRNPAFEMPQDLIPSTDQLPAVDYDLLQHVLDKTTDRSKRPFYHLLTVAAIAPVDLLESQAQLVTYNELWNEPDRFRGQLIRLEGYLRGLQPWQATEHDSLNRLGIKVLYDGYLFTDDSRPNPYVVVLPRVADGMPIGSNISENITFAGYFFKLWRYKAADGTERAAPLLVGQMINWTPTPVHPGSAHLSGYLAAAFLLLVASLGGTIWAINHRRAAKRVSGSGSVDSAVLTDLERLESVDMPASATSLDQIQVPEPPRK